MIVVDTNVLAYFLIEGEHTREARGVFVRDPVWLAPPLWRSEFRNVLALNLRRGIFPLERSLELMGTAEALMLGKEFGVASAQVLSLAAISRCSAYDCEFIALAQDLGLPLIIFDKAVLAAFPSTAISPFAFSP